MGNFSWFIILFIFDMSAGFAFHKNNKNLSLKTLEAIPFQALGSEPLDKEIE